MILDSRVVGRIDQIQAHIELGARPKDKHHEALAKWSDALNTLSNSFAARIQ